MRNRFQIKQGTLIYVGPSSDCPPVVHGHRYQITAKLARIRRSRVESLVLVQTHEDGMRSKYAIDLSNHGNPVWIQDEHREIRRLVEASAYRTMAHDFGAVRQQSVRGISGSATECAVSEQQIGGGTIAHGYGLVRANPARGARRSRRIDPVDVAQSGGRSPFCDVWAWT